MNSQIEGEEKKRAKHPSVFALFAALAATGTPVDDQDYQCPFEFNGTITKLTLLIDRPKLSPEDIKRLEEAQRNNKVSE